MRFCVVKGSTKIIDGSDNPTEVMVQNAQNAGFTESEVEILTEEEYQQRIENEPEPFQAPTAEERLQALEDAMIFLTLGGM